MMADPLTPEEIAALPSGLAEARALLAERDRYRDALHRIATVSDSYPVAPREIARAALND